MRWFWLIAPALLIIIAGRQVYLSQAHHLSPWSGGGFGMFSSLDAGQRRIITVNLQYDGIRRTYPLPKSLRDLAQRTATLPTPDRMKQFALEVEKIIHSNKLISGQDTPYTMTLSLWRVHYEPHNLVMSEEVITTHTFTFNTASRLQDMVNSG